MDEKCREVVRCCQRRAADGTIMFTPDGVGHYPRLWTRDFCYLVREGWEFLEPTDVKQAIRTLLNAQRKDGAMPDSVGSDLVPFYRPGNSLQPCGSGPTLDNPLFMVSLIYSYARQSGDRRFAAESLPALVRGMEQIPIHCGLVFNDPQSPCSTYGFQDTVAKTGHDLFCSLLWIQSCLQLAELLEEADAASGAKWREASALAEAQLHMLWDEETGAFFAADYECRQIDIWGTAFAVSHRLGRGADLERAAEFLVANHREFTWRGQVSHLRAGESWQRTFVPVEPGTYQNGGFWATPSLWMAESFRGADPDLARRFIADLAEFYNESGIYEWSSPSGAHGPDLYVASIFNARRILTHSLTL